jgi:hypothetical protein
MGRPTHDRLAALRQAGRISPKGERGGGTTWPASSFFYNIFLQDCGSGIDLYIGSGGKTVWKAVREAGRKLGLVALVALVAPSSRQWR